MFDKLRQTSEFLLKDSDAISDERKQLLNELSIYIKEKLSTTKQVNLVFICTHNSRRSHMAQLWAKAAAHLYGIKNLHTFSGGTQKTAFNVSAVNALKKSGFKFTIEKEGKNQRYKVKYDKRAKPIICFSKVYNHKKNPTDGFVAVMTCSDADEACPVVVGADYRTTIKYEDPKKYDGTANQEQAYLNRSHQIGREMLYVFKEVSRMMSQ